MTKLHDLADLGQAVWLDSISRSLIDSGELQALVEQGARGVTSNPTIFEQAISGSADYDAQLVALAREGRGTKEIYEALAIEDIRRAADVLYPVYVESRGVDGYVSLEADPRLANDTQATIAEGRRLFSALNRPNILIKVPATPAGAPAIESLISEGVNVNVTLIFSLAQYDAIADAYIAGLERRVARGEDVSAVASVASFFVSRVDGKIDPLVERMGRKELRGKIAVANAKVAYARFQEVYGHGRWKRLERCGARVQRCLWGSTSTKNPDYPDTLYVDELVGPDTVNTMPPQTLKAVLDHGRIEQTVTSGLDLARAQLRELDALGIYLKLKAEEGQEKRLTQYSKPRLPTTFVKRSQRQFGLAELARQTHKQLNFALLLNWRNLDDIWHEIWYARGDVPVNVGREAGSRKAIPRTVSIQTPACEEKSYVRRSSTS